MFVSHGSTEAQGVMDDDQQLITSGEVRGMLQGRRLEYITRVLPPALAKIYQATQAGDRAVAQEARLRMQALGEEDREIVRYVVEESQKVHLDLTYVEHFSCYSGMQGAQEYADLLMADSAEYVGYDGPTDASGRPNRFTYGGFTAKASRFRPTAGRGPDPNPVETVRKRRQQKTGTGAPSGLCLVCRKCGKPFEYSKLPSPPPQRCPACGHRELLFKSAEHEVWDWSRRALCADVMKGK